MFSLPRSVRSGGICKLAAASLGCFFREMISWLMALRQRSRWKELVILIGAVTFFLCLWSFLELAEDAPGGEFLPRETRFMRALRQPDDLSQPIGPSWTVEAARDLTGLGGAMVLTLVTVLVLGYLFLRGARGAALLVLCATFGGFLLSSALKQFFDRPRPTIIPHLAPAVSASFPSGHSMLSSIVYLTLGALLARTVARRRERIYLIGVSLLLTLLIGFSRVYLGVHYPTDVLGGWTAGTAWALLCWCAAHTLQQRGRVKRANELYHVDEESTPPSFRS